MEPTYFYSLVSFIVLSVVIVLVYIFLAEYMKNIYVHLKRLIDYTDRRLGEIEKKIDKLPKK